MIFPLFFQPPDQSLPHYRADYPLNWKNLNAQSAIVICCQRFFISYSFFRHLLSDEGVIPVMNNIQKKIRLMSFSEAI